MRILSLGDLTGLASASTANTLFLYTTPFHNYGCSVLLNSTLQRGSGGSGGDNNNSNFNGTGAAKIRSSLTPPSYFSNGQRRVCHRSKGLGCETDHSYPPSEEFKKV